MDGIVIFAYNSTFDYVRIAEVAAKQAKKFLNLPVTLITNVDVNSPHFDNVIKRDLDGVSSSRAFLQPTGDVIQSA
jgi:tRNA A37 threonylcarbamoyladenosine synthetase subunit TsaC/SUA5/YrdC